MPTTPKKARILLQVGKAQIAKRNPFTIQLIHGSSGYTQPITLGWNTNFKYISFNAITEKEELIGGELEMLDGMTERIIERAMYRTQRRDRLRYSTPKFDNRRH